MITNKMELFIEIFGMMQTHFKESTPTRIVDFMKLQHLVMAALNPSEEMVVVAIVEVEGEIAGLCVAHVQDSGIYKLKTVHDVATYIKPEFRGQGLVRQLISDIEEWGVKMKADEILIIHAKTDISGYSNEAVARMKQLGAS